MEYDTIDVPQAELDALALEASLYAMKVWRVRQEKTSTVTMEKLGLSVTVTVEETSQ